jgi:hypothetical protein
MLSISSFSFRFHHIHGLQCWARHGCPGCNVTGTAFHCLLAVKRLRL